MLTIAQLEALRPELDAWNLRQQQARNEYARHPIAACEGTRRIDWRGVLLEFPCEEMATDEQLCRTCQSGATGGCEEGAEPEAAGRGGPMTVEQIKAALDEHPDRCRPVYGSCALLSGHEGPHHGYPDDLAEVIAALMPEVRAAALREAADKWQWGEWANAPRRADRVRERIANAQFVTDWLRERAANEVTDA